MVSSTGSTLQCSDFDNKLMVSKMVIEFYRPYNFNSLFICMHINTSKLESVY